ncbi:hypothetical protein [Jidongwangia harbinensis]|uniref:hypothetical protein n=1 Tax=Jidongwangia harbinensis TaxID=2878561 RepID=UPI001CD9C4A6|nr:hypothetical protein [Jidongwangia harbinensis]MCA2219223.1 hypothetical protein [Jidongwangia harbinensis]
MFPFATTGPPLTTLEPDDLGGWWIWYALSQVWRLLAFLEGVAPWLAVAVVAALVGLGTLIRTGTRRRAAARAVADGPTGTDREGLADVGLGRSDDD